MNCKPGDIAVMVAGEWMPENCGCLFEVLSNYKCDEGEWYLKALSACQTNSGPVSAGTHVWGYDSDLRPITPPKGEVTDSEVKELYSPNPIKEVA
jgi:hypothetical protein